MSKKVTLNAAGDAATVATATLTDVFSTLVSTDSAVTGMYGLLQRFGLFAAGASVASKRLTGNFNPLQKV